MTQKAYQTTGRNGRTIAFRLRPGTDLMTGLKNIAAENSVRAAYIPVIIGGVNAAEIEEATPSPDSPVGVVAKHIHLTGPIAIIAAQGMICELNDGSLEPHLHIAFVDANGHVHGGHLLAGTAPVTTTVDGIMQEVLDVKFGRGFDAEVKTTLFFPAAR
ncbi:MAG: DNA-binding protein [Planctomycetes bacterium]|nr:DNA-binding protein [Planctomycetota bacterium]